MEAAKHTYGREILHDDLEAKQDLGFGSEA